MILCRVIGSSWSSVQQACYDGKSILVVQMVGTDGHQPQGAEFLAVDSVQAGPGDLVLVAREGNAARQVLGRDTDPLHSVILAIVDEIDVGDRQAVGNDWGRA